MKPNKHFIYTIATAIIFSLTLISCNDDVENGNGSGASVRKLPSKVTTRSLTYGDTEVINFNYDSRNRLTEIVFESDGWSERQVIEYDANGRISRINSIRPGNVTTLSFEYISNTVIVTSNRDNAGTQILTLNANGQLTSAEWNWQGSGWREREVATFTYSAGNLMRVLINGFEESDWGSSSWEGVFNYTYSTYLNIFRHATSPDWLVSLFLGDFMGFLLFPPSRNMPSKVDAWGDEFAFTHDADSDGYVISSLLTITWDDNWDEWSSNIENYSTRHFSNRENGVSTFKLRSNRAQASANSERIMITYEYILAQ